MIKIGQPAYTQYAELCAEYERRLSGFAVIKNITFRLKSPEERLPAALVKLYHEETRNSGTIWIDLDTKGPLWSSEQLAKQLASWRDDPAIKKLFIVIGGPFGLTESAIRFDMTWSLSPATFTSDLAWLIVWEQLYRGFSILAGSDYHHS